MARTGPKQAKKPATFPCTPDKAPPVLEGLVGSSHEPVNPRKFRPGRGGAARIRSHVRLGHGGRVGAFKPRQWLAPRPGLAVDIGGRRAVPDRRFAVAVVAASAQPVVDEARPSAAPYSQSDRDGPVVLRDDLAHRAGDADAGQGSAAAETRPQCSELLDRARPRTLAGNHERPVLMMDFVAELWRFMRVRKKFWLLPILIMMVVFGGLVVLTKGSVFAPFIYTLF